MYKKDKQTKLARHRLVRTKIYMYVNSGGRTIKASAKSEEPPSELGLTALTRSARSGFLG